MVFREIIYSYSENNKKLYFILVYMIYTTSGLYRVKGNIKYSGCYSFVLISRMFFAR
jgi:hypothetical protein